MTRSDALLDAALTVRHWRGVAPSKADQVMRHVARALRCSPSWRAIADEIARRMSEEDRLPLRLAA